MGTGGEWIEVILSAVFWGGGMLLFDSMTGKNAETRSHSHWASDLGTALGGLLFGLSSTFGLRRAFHIPLLLLSGGIILAMCLVGMLIRKRTVRREVQ